MLENDLGHGVVDQGLLADVYAALTNHLTAVERANRLQLAKSLRIELSSCDLTHIRV